MVTEAQKAKMWDWFADGICTPGDTRVEDAMEAAGILQLRPSREIFEAALLAAMGGEI
jgi:hypothetical protein